MARFSFTGRMVQGKAHTPGAQRKDKAGTLKFRKDGSPDSPFYLAVAVPKNPAQRLQIPGTPDYESQKAIVDSVARAAWPDLFNKTRPQGLHFPNPALPLDCISPKFALKVVDGDGFDDSGNPNNKNEGWGGCWVIKVSNGFAPKCYEWGAQGWEELTPHSPRKIKCGDYITVSGEADSNKSTDSPGVYLNFDTVSFEQEGAEIQQSESVDPNKALGSRGPNAASPQASANVASTGGAVAGAPTSTTASAYSGYREGAPPPPADTAGAPPPPAEPQMTAKAQYSYQGYRDSGWSDDQLRAGGFMV